MTKTDSFTIRNAHEDEFASIGKLLVSVYTRLDGFPTINEQPKYYSMLANIGDITRFPGVEILVAVTESHHIAGAVVYFGDMQYYGSGGAATKERNAAGFRLLGVRPENRGLGIGKALSEACIEKARLGHVNQVIIHSTQAMRVAWKMYWRLGFRRSTDLDFMQEDLAVYGFRLDLNE